MLASDRAQLIDRLRGEFPAAAAVDPAVAAPRGGRRAAEAILAALDPVAYAATRNHLHGAVTRLAPYLRHGVLSLAEVRTAALSRVPAPHKAAKLINELGWRDYYQRVYAAIGDGVWRDIEPYKTGLTAADYAPALPADIEQGATGLACIDAFSSALRTTGYLHNHARMWLAAYVVHFRRVQWQAGARWFLTHLLDGDPASNNLSWQWVASTFSHKPYYFNRENLERNTGGEFCRRCPLQARCPLEGSYEQLAARLFVADQPAAAAESDASARLSRVAPAPLRPAVPARRPVVWIHGDNLSPFSPALLAHPGAAALWVWDEDLLAQGRVSFKRIVFLAECLAELPVTLRRGDVAAELLRFAAAHGADQVVTNASPSPRFAAIRAMLARTLPVAVLDPAPFVAPARPLDLRRFSRYWRQVEQAALAGAI